MQSFGVGETARRCGTTIRTLQYYDRIGLLTADRDSGGRRRYRVTHIDRLRQIQLMSGAGFGLDEIADILDRGSDRSPVQSYATQVRYLEVAELRLRCQRAVLSAVADLLADHPDARVPADVLVATMSLDDTLLRFPDVLDPPAELGGLDVQQVITDYFDWKADAVQAAIMIENDIPAGSPAGRRLGRRRHRAARRVLQDQPEAAGAYVATEQDHLNWPTADRDLYLRTKGFLDRCEQQSTVVGTVPADGS